MNLLMLDSLVAIARNSLSGVRHWMDMNNGESSAFCIWNFKMRYPVEFDNTLMTSQEFIAETNVVDFLLILIFLFSTACFLKRGFMNIFSSVARLRELHKWKRWCLSKLKQQQKAAALGVNGVGLGDKEKDKENGLHIDTDTYTDTSSAEPQHVHAAAVLFSKITECMVSRRQLIWMGIAQLILAHTFLLSAVGVADPRLMDFGLIEGGDVWTSGFMDLEKSFHEILTVLQLVGLAIVLKGMWGLILKEANRALAVRLSQKAAFNAILVASSFTGQGSAFSYTGMVPLIDFSFSETSASTSASADERRRSINSIGMSPGRNRSLSSKSIKANTGAGMGRSVSDSSPLKGFMLDALLVLLEIDNNSNSNSNSTNIKKDRESSSSGNSGNTYSGNAPFSVIQGEAALSDTSNDLRSVEMAIVEKGQDLAAMDEHEDNDVDGIDGPDIGARTVQDVEYAFPRVGELAEQLVRAGSRSTRKYFVIWALNFVAGLGLGLRLFRQFGPFHGLDGLGSSVHARRGLNLNLLQALPFNGDNSIGGSHGHGMISGSGSVRHDKKQRRMHWVDLTSLPSTDFGLLLADISLLLEGCFVLAEYWPGLPGFGLYDQGLSLSDTDTDADTDTDSKS